MLQIRIVGAAFFIGTDIAFAACQTPVRAYRHVSHLPRQGACRLDGR
jgi:hypothetical protein